MVARIELGVALQHFKHHRIVVCQDDRAVLQATIQCFTYVSEHCTIHADSTSHGKASMSDRSAPGHLTLEHATASTEACKVWLTLYKHLIRISCGWDAEISPGSNIRVQRSCITVRIAAGGHACAATRPGKPRPEPSSSAQGQPAMMCILAVR